MNTPPDPRGRPQAPHWAEGLEALLDAHDGFIVDQFGVLHDGQTPAAGAAEALLRLRASGRRVIVLSNSGKRAQANQARLLRFGFDARHMDALLTSGELLHQLLAARRDAPFDRIGRRLWLADAAEDTATLAGLDIEPVDRLEQAGAIVLASLPDQAGAAEALRPALARGLRFGLPLLCANPDRLRLSRRGIELSAGTLAAEYEAAGGEVVWIGKPHGLIFAACAAQLDRLGAHRPVMVGDSLEHDIAGGAAAGHATCLVTGGLLQHEFPPEVWRRPDERTARLQRLCADTAATPDWVLPALAFSTPADDDMAHEENA